MNGIIRRPENIEKYLSGVFESELNIYVQEQTLAEMKNTYNRLGIPRRIDKPKMAACETDISFYMLVMGSIGGVLYGLIKNIIEFIRVGGGFWHFILAIIMFIVCFIIGFIVSGLTVGTVAGLIALYVEKQKKEEAYQKDLKSYDAAIERDQRRVRLEKKQKELLYKEISDMEFQIANNKNRLMEIYNYNILYPDYQNIYAVSSIYGYFKKGRTASLTFNSQNGDPGAYNIYENELRANIIIRNTQEIINRLDEIASYQYELADGLQRAHERINSLSSNINSHMKRASESLQNIERCQSVIEYNTAQTKNQLDFMTWLQLTYH